MEHRNGSDDATARFRQLEERVSELQAETGAEALELRARVRALEDRIAALVAERGESSGRDDTRKAEAREAKAARKMAREKRRQAQSPDSER